MPKDEKFFFLLHQSAMNIQQVAMSLLDLMQNFENVPAKVAEIKETVGRVIYIDASLIWYGLSYIIYYLSVLNV